jgi:sulfur-oxidizing protein SoxY
MTITRRELLAGASAALLLPFAARAQADAPDPDKSEVWQKVRKGVLDGRSVANAGPELLVLEAPVRAEDAAVVPIAIRTRLQQSPDRYIRRIYLVIDKNPSPVGAVFDFTPLAGRADIETRVRIEEYTHVRAVAELNDGSLHQATRFVKASGGCSAPAGKDLQEALARLGKTRFRVEGDVSYGQPALAQLMVSHPNVSGLGKDQVTHLYEPAYYVRKVAVTYGDKPVMTADIDFTISENPNFRFYFLPQGPGELKAEIVDTKDKTFAGAVKVTAGPAAPRAAP